jgi:4'-phosphopantetheinyl transferase
VTGVVEPEAHLEVAELDLGAEAIARSRAVLAADESARAARFLRDQDRLRFVAARAMLRGVLGRALGIAPATVAFVYGPHGKPALAPPLSESGVRFNLSHSGGRALVAWTVGREVGADLELVRPVRYGVKIARRFFSDDEQAAFVAVEPLLWDETFFRCWTRKEAFIKAIGDGLSYPLQSFSVSMTIAPARAGVRVDGDEHAVHRWRLSAVDAGPGFLAAVVVEHGSPSSAARS